MELINKNSESVLGMTRTRRNTDTVTVTGYGLYFSKSFCNIHRVKSGKFIHFINDGADWKFFINDDNDGFLLVDDKRLNGSLRVFNAGLSHLIERTVNKKPPMAFRISKTNLEFKGQKQFMIHTDKIIELKLK